MIVSIMQPAFLPWLGYFNRLLLSDLHIVLDHVQIDKSSKTNFANRNRIRIREGSMWLTVPIVRKGKSNDLALNRIQISDDHGWAAKSWASIAHNYARTPYFARYAPQFQPLFQSPGPRLIDVTASTTDALLQAFAITVERRSSSQLGVTSSKDDLILDLLKQVGATCYISGPFGRQYLDPAKFREARIDLVFHDYEHPRYPQAFEGFEPYMSAIDLLFNCGPEAREILSRPQELKRV